MSLAPYKFFVERIAGGTLEIKVMVPSGASPHFFEPTARQLLQTAKAEIWFQIGESFEARATPALKSHNKKMEIVDMRDGISLIYPEGVDQGCSCCLRGCADPHIWLSPRLVQQQAKAIAAALSRICPENTKIYQKALAQFLEELETLDKEIREILALTQDRRIVVSHPAFAYFARDYGLKQISIEFEGKDPSPRHLTEVLQLSRGAHRVFVQEQHLSKGARLVAEAIGAEVVVVDPLAENYYENMRKLARDFSMQ